MPHYNDQEIKFTLHAAGYTERRGFSLAEAEEAIKKSEWISSDKGRLECRMNIPFGKDWNGKHYETKQIRPIFVVEGDEIIVVTVFTYYF
jgi:hypothetical protein